MLTPRLLQEDWEEKDSYKTMTAMGILATVQILLSAVSQVGRTCLKSDILCWTSLQSVIFTDAWSHSGPTVAPGISEYHRS